MSDVQPRVLAILPFLTQHMLALAVLRELRRRGAEVALALWHAPSADYSDDGIEDFTGNRVGEFYKFRPDEIGTKLDEMIASMAANVVVQWDGPLAAYRHLARARERRPQVAFLDALYNDAVHTTNHFLFERAFDAVIVESHQMQECVVRNTLKADSAIYLAESGVDLQQFSPADQSADTKRLTIGFVGRLSEEKNPLGFIELCEQIDSLLGPSPAISYRMYGQGPQAAAVRIRLAASPVSDRLSFEGYVPDMPSVLRSLDALVVPSRLDGRPRVVMEANASGIPVIAYPVGGISEMIEEGMNGHVVRPTDAALVAHYLQRWLDNRESLLALKASSRRIAERRFDARRMFDTYHDIMLKAASLAAARGQ